MLISVVICTHNRAALLSLALESLAAQAADLPVSEYETLVVDNCSSDNTRQVVESFLEKIPNLRYVFEEKIGLSHARNRGWHEAHGEYVGYLDDDALAVPGWLRTAAQVITEIHPAILGGPVLPLYQSGKPAWYKDSYSVNIRRDSPGPFQGFISGGNTFNRKSILNALGGYNPEFGMSGNKIGYAEETDLQIRLHERFPGEIVYYHPDIAIRHHIPAYKMRMGWIIRSRYINASAYTKATLRVRPHLIKALTRTLLYSMLFLFDLAKGIVRDRRRYPYWQNYVYEKIGADVARVAVATTHIIIALDWRSNKWR
jgi:glycosyltransferase involved in cell wall biosynthesis